MKKCILYKNKQKWTKVHRNEVEMEYTTQMDAARKGIITKEMEAVSKYENMDVNHLRELVVKGQVAIPANKNRCV